MQEKDLKPSTKQRLIFALVAAILLGSSIAAYVLIVMGNGNVNYAKMTLEQLNEAYNEAYSQYQNVEARLSSQYFDEFKSYKPNVKAYNSNTANSNGIQAKDLKEGDGEALTESNYAAYYIGWCSDESIFDSSFDNFDDPTSLKAPLSIQPNMLIEGWYLGTEGMKMHGTREITIPGSLAYGDSTEICGGTNSPLKFIVMAVEKDQELTDLETKLNKITNAMISLQSSSSNYSTYTDTSESEATTGE